MANALKAMLFYTLSRVLKKAIIKHQPFAISIEPTSICNLKCPECPTGTNTLKRPRGKISLTEYQNILNQLPKELTYLNLYIQGEPTMHPDFPEMIKLAKQKKLYTSTSTNGHFITPNLAHKIVQAGLTRIIFSIDGTTQDSYDKYRTGGQLSKAINGFINIAEAKVNLQKHYPIVIFQFLVFEHNEHQLKAAKKMASELSANKIEFKTSQFNNYKHTNVAPPTLNKFRRYEDSYQLKLKGKLHNACWRQWHSTVITWDGKVAPCCYDKDADYELGNIQSNTFPKIWKSDNNQRFKSVILSHKNSISICQNCPEGRRFWS